MKLEQQVCSLEQSKKLKSLGVNGKSIFYWWDFNKVSKSFFHGNPKLQYGNICPGASAEAKVNAELKECFSPAFTAAEIGVMLPCRVWVGDDMYQLSLMKSDETWHKKQSRTNTSFHYEYDFVNKENQIEVLGGVQVGNINEAVSRAEILIWLLENKHTTAEEVNSRLNS
jgi:hypothetical protein